MMTPNTTAWPRAAPSTASDNAKAVGIVLQAQRPVPRRRCRSSSSGRSFRHTVLAFFIRPVRVDTAPGVPMPTRQGTAADRSRSRISVAQHLDDRVVTGRAPGVLPAFAQVDDTAGRGP